MVQMIKIIGLSAAAAVLFILNGCSLDGQPRARLGSYATSTPGTRFLGPKDLGHHSYNNLWSENNGIIYTCRGGHIDIAHLRIGADYTRYLYNLTYKKLSNERTDFTFKLNVEPSIYHVTLTYPDSWKTLSKDERERRIYQLSFELSQYFAFTMTTWHELLTFYGYKCMAVLPEEPSAFSWEDIYSNLLGIRLGIQAAQCKGDVYDEAITNLLQKELEKLQIQSAHTAWYASEKMRGQWFEGIVLVRMIQRNMDIGLDDGFVTPILVPGICQDAAPLSYPVPKLDLLKRFGFIMHFEVEPAEFEKGSLLRIIYPDGGGKRIRFPEDLEKIMAFTRNEAVNRGYHIMPPRSRAIPSSANQTGLKVGK